MNAGTKKRLATLAACLDAHGKHYRELRNADSFGAYIGGKGGRADEELLTEPILRELLEHVLGFPRDGYFAQLGKSGLKPDFTPLDLSAHPFVLDAKASDEPLGKHEDQIRSYVVQRSLDYGVLFNLRELKVFRRAPWESVPELSFSLLPLWQVAHGEALPTTGDVEAFERFFELYRYREMTVAQKIAYVRGRPGWAARIAADEPLAVDVEFLVDRLRRLSRLLAEDAGAQPEALDGFLRMNPGRDEKLLQELRLLALDIQPGVDLEQLPVDVAGWRAEEGLARRVWGQYLLRVSYLALTRILLYRAWEDVQYVGEYLYDGGFDVAYERMARNVRDVLAAAFAEGARRYHWLYGGNNNYDWYRPREAALVEVLYALAPVPLGKLDADVLGGLYVSYVDEIDRDRLGQFFTPRSVIAFMLDRAGFSGREGVFRIEGDRRVPLRVLDFATGSGGFLVEAARRIIDKGGLDPESPRDLEEGLEAIVTGFVGGEISPFPYYLTEVNLLLQASRLVGALTLGGRQPPRFTLGVLHVDTLAAKSVPDRSLDVEPEHRADRAELVRDERFDLVPLDEEKLARYRRLREDESFDLVVGNPPYVTEANNKPLFERLRAIPAWKDLYRGKTDYLYYFLWLAVEKLAPGGRLCVITPAGWMNAGRADVLRRKLATELRLDELFLFGNYRLFAPEQGRAPTPTIESAILVATKAPAGKRHRLRVVVLENESEAGQGSREDLLGEMAQRAAGRAGRKGGIHVHDMIQSELRPERPWPVKFASGDLASRAVSHLQGRLEEESGAVEPLAASWKTFTGIETAADAYSRRIDKQLTPEARRKIEAAGAKLGDPILERPAGSELEDPWVVHPEFLAKSPEARAILYAAIDDDDYSNLVLIDRGERPPDDILAVLEPWKPLLSARAEIARNSRRKWWETAWPRDRGDLGAPKVVALYRTDRGRFALDESGGWKPGKKLTLAVGRAPDAPVAYLCGLLNSELLDLWYAVRGKAPRDVWRNYEPKRMNEIPYRRPEGDPRAERVAELVRAIAANRRALLPLRPVVRDLGRIVKDPWKDGPVEIDVAGLIAEQPTQETVSIRLAPELSVEPGPGKPGAPKRASATVLALGRWRVSGSPAWLDVLERVLTGKKPADPEAILLPRDLGDFARLAAEREHEVRELLDEGRRRVEEVERLVCALFDVPPELTEEVVEHAVQRAKRGSVDSTE